MNDCALWCEGVWTYKEYIVIFFPVFTFIVSMAIYAYVDEIPLNIAIAGSLIASVIGAIIALLVVSLSVKDVSNMILVIMIFVGGGWFGREVGVFLRNVKDRSNG